MSAISEPLVKQRYDASEYSFSNWTLEQVLAAIGQHTTAEWCEHLFDRYLDFAKVHRLIG